MRSKVSLSSSNRLMRGLRECVYLCEDSEVSLSIAIRPGVISHAGSQLRALAAGLGQGLLPNASV